MHFIREDRVRALVESFREDDFLINVRRWIISEDGFKAEQPVVDIGPLGIV